MNSESDTNLSDANTTHANDTNGGDTNLGHTNDTNAVGNRYEPNNTNATNGGATNMEGNKKNWVLIVGVVVLLLVTVILSLYIFDIYPFEKEKSLSVTEELSSNSSFNTPQNESVQTDPGDLLLDSLPLVISLLPQIEEVTLNKGKKNNYSSFWNTESATASASFTALDNTISHLLLAFPFIHNEPISTDSASTIASEYVSINPKGEWKCTTTQSGSTYCENFWSDDGMKKGIGIQSPHAGLQENLYSLIYCQNTVDSIFHSWNSCNGQYKDNGIQ